MRDRAVRCGGGGVAAARWWLAGRAAAKTPSPQAEALAMSCSVAIPSSPVFSPSRRPLSCKAASASPESVSVSSPAPSTAGSPLRPFGLLRAQIREEASPSPKTSSVAPSVAAGSVLKRRRPALLMVLVDGAAAAAAAVAAVASVESDLSNEVEEEGEEFAAYCRRGRGRRRVEMEDRHVAKVALGGDPEVIRRRQPLRQRRRQHHRRRSTISCQCERRDGGEDGCSWCACAQWRRKGLGCSVGAEGRRCGRIVSMAATPRRSEWSRTY